MLPLAFVRRVINDLGVAEGEALCQALEGESPVSIRLNPAKDRVAPSAHRVPWSTQGYYLSTRPSFTLDPDFHAGRYYVQEASSQFVGHILSHIKGVQGCRLLDMCAAPGGKTTLYASLVGVDGLVVANEAVRNRVSALVDNVCKWGLGNVAVTVDDSSGYQRLEGWFDVVAVDAPCSGEGMFRKAEQARQEWSESNVTMCAQRQLAILRNAWQALRPGGTLIYSTCTFNFVENEGVLRAFASEFAGQTTSLPPLPVQSEWGIVTGNEGHFQTFRFYPHRVEGEGFFVAVVCKESIVATKTRWTKPQRMPLAEVDRRSVAELQRWVVNADALRFYQVAESCYAYRASQAEAMKWLSGMMTVIYSGVEMGQIYKGLLKPAHALALYVELSRDATAVATLSEEEALTYLRRGNLSIDCLTEGMNLVTVHNVALGYAKRIGRRCNNLYPNSLRILKM
jgi:16S rRNA C967 or C1407 C5-methylase (RsmB/RsmF family)/NOL1/NOP2/fmu family ribosome biogenesis protein